MSAQLSAFVPCRVLELSLCFYSLSFPPSGRRRALYSLSAMLKEERETSQFWSNSFHFETPLWTNEGRESRGNIDMTSADQSSVPDSPPRARALSASLGMILNSASLNTVAFLLRPSQSVACHSQATCRREQDTSRPITTWDLTTRKGWTRGGLARRTTTEPY